MSLTGCESTLRALQEQVTHLKISAYEAREESSAQVKARIEQAKADAAADQEPVRDKAGQAGGRAHGQWRSMKADAAAKMQGLQDRMDRKSDELDAKMAEDDAEGACTGSGGESRRNAGRAGYAGPLPVASSAAKAHSATAMSLAHQAIALATAALVAAAFDRVTAAS